jgi:hypothetical protein
MPIVNKTYNLNISDPSKLSDYIISADFVQGSTAIPLTVTTTPTTITVSSGALPIGNVGDYQIKISINSINYCP